MLALCVILISSGLLSEGIVNWVVTERKVPQRRSLGATLRPLILSRWTFHFSEVQFMMYCSEYLHCFSCCITKCTGAAFLILFVLGSESGSDSAAASPRDPALVPADSGQRWRQCRRALSQSQPSCRSIDQSQARSCSLAPQTSFNTQN